MTGGPVGQGLLVQMLQITPPLIKDWRSTDPEVVGRRERLLLLSG